MKTKPTIGATLSFLVMSIIISFAFATTASAEPIRHKFGWQKIPAHCDQGTLRQQGYQLMTGAQCGYETQPCLNGSADGYAVRTTIKADVVYVCDKRGVPRWKHDCGNQIEVQERQERVEQGQVVQQQQSGFNLQEVFNGLCTVAQYGLQLYQVGQSYGYQSQQYIQSCQYVERCQPSNYTEIKKTVNNYYIDNSVNGSYNTSIVKINKTTTNPIICVTTPGQTGVGPIVDSGNSRTPVGDNGQIVSADGTLPYTTTKAAAKTAVIGTETGNNPTGATGRNKPGQTSNLEVASVATSAPQGAIRADGTLDTANSRQAMRAQRNAATTTAAPAPAQTTATQTPTTTASIPPATTGGRVKKEVASVASAQTPTQTDAPQGAIRRDGSLDTANTRRTSRANRTAETTTPASTTGQIASALPAPAVPQATVPQASTLKPSRKEARQASPVQPVSTPTTGQIASVPSAKTFSADSIKPVGRTRGNNVGNIPNAKTFSQPVASTGSVPSVQSVPKATTFKPMRATSSGSIGSIPPASSMPKASSFSSGSTGGSGRIASNFSMPKQSSFTSTPRTMSGPSFSAPRVSGGNTGNLPTFGGGNNGGGGRNMGGKKGR